MNAGTGVQIITLREGVAAVTFHPNGLRAALGGDLGTICIPDGGTVTVVDARDGAPLVQRRVRERLGLAAGLGVGDEHFVGQGGDQPVAGCGRGGGGPPPALLERG
ncbi:MAG: hypothetical protein M5U01_16755 [Ardenticatenaceae bacterium]|nr:hypothetical protein [Ardenticatenaceae bacterium]